MPNSLCGLWRFELRTPCYSASSLSLRATLQPGKISLDLCLKPNINSFLWSCSFHAQLPALWGEPRVRQQRLLQASSQWLVEMVQAVFSKRHLVLSTSQPASLNSHEHPKLWAPSFPFCKQIKQASHLLKVTATLKETAKRRFTPRPCSSQTGARTHCIAAEPGSAVLSPPIKKEMQMSNHRCWF